MNAAYRSGELRGALAELRQTILSNRDELRAPKAGWRDALVVIFRSRAPRGASVGANLSRVLIPIAGDRECWVRDRARG